MKHKTIALCVAFISAMLTFSASVYAQNVLPNPTHFVAQKGKFVPNAQTVIQTNLTGDAQKRILNALHQVLPQVNTLATHSVKKNVITLMADSFVTDIEAVASNTSLQSYSLTISANGITIKGATETAVFYGIQTLSSLIKNNKWFSNCTITDSPRFSWRGYMLDCSRHYFSPSFIKKQIDMLASLKMNRLHLHMVDGAGWRIQIDSYPLLTQKTAYRTNEDWNKWWIEGKRTYCEKDSIGAYGGFYTKQELKDIVAYAEQKHVVILPEIEMPGHSEEVTYAYPELSCTGIPYTCSDLCVGNEATFTFLQKVLDEIIEIFPSYYIHIGGDEAAQDKWKTCPKCLQRMKEHNLKNTHELQSYMITRIGNYLMSKKRAFIGWDEIMEGGLSPNAAVMSWRGYEAGIAAAKAGHHVVMSPVNFCYLDYYQDNPTTEPQAMGGYVPLSKVYEYNPLPDSLKGTKAEQFINGVQGNLWTECVSTPSHAEYMTYPRLMAIAETGWSYHKTSFDMFKKRVIATTQRMQNNNYNPYDVRKADKPRVEFVTPVKHQAVGAKVIYTTMPADKYKGAGDATLTDGKRGSWSYVDGRWQGFCADEKMEVVIDLGKETELKNISAEFMQFLEPWIEVPTEINIYTSNDNKTYQLLWHKDIARSSVKYFIQNYEWVGKASARYIKYHAKTSKPGVWVFTDEIVVNK